MIETPVLVVGAGPGGLAVAGRFRQAGLDFEIIEKSDRVGSSWHQHYDRLHLHTVKELSHLPGMPFPDDYPRYVPRKALADYYGEYARVMSIAPRFGEEAISVSRDGDKWLTRTQTGLAFSSPNVVLSTGVNRVPHRPDYPDERSFEGVVLHSRQYRNPDPFIGQKVLVVGMGNTGAEIALDLSERGIDTTISVRGPVNIVPRDVLGRPTQLTARMLARLPESLGDRIGILLRNLTVGDLSGYGIETPELAPLAQLRVEGKTPVIDVGTVSRIKSGAIAVAPGIDRFVENGVAFVNGERHRFDSVILATGYRPQLGDLLDDSDGLLDDSGAPSGCIGTGTHQGLFFVGYDNHQPGGILGTVVEESALVIESILL